MRASGGARASRPQRTPSEGVLSSTGCTTAHICAPPPRRSRPAHSCSLFQPTALSLPGLLAAAATALALATSHYLHPRKHPENCPDTRGQGAWPKARGVRSAHPPAQDGQPCEGRRRRSMHHSAHLVQLHEGFRGRARLAAAKNTISGGAQQHRSHHCAHLRSATAPQPACSLLLTLPSS